jgi:hypothetical protein
MQPAYVSRAMYVSRKRGGIQIVMVLMGRGICCNLTAANEEYHKRAVC